MYATIKKEELREVVRVAAAIKADTIEVSTYEHPDFLTYRMVASGVEVRYEGTSFWTQCGAAKFPVSALALPTCAEVTICTVPGAASIFYLSRELKLGDDVETSPFPPKQVGELACDWQYVRHLLADLKESEDVPGGKKLQVRFDVPEYVVVPTSAIRALRAMRRDYKVKVRRAGEETQIEAGPFTVYC